MRKRDVFAAMIIAAAAGAGIHHVYHCRIKPRVDKIREDVKEAQQAYRDAYSAAFQAFGEAAKNPGVPRQANAPVRLEDMQDKKPANG